MIKVSSQAKEKVVQMMQSDGVDIASHFVRVGVKSGGCSGTTLEYSGGLNGKGFVFNNPNANRTCGCGESFSL